MIYTVEFVGLFFSSLDLWLRCQLTVWLRLKGLGGSVQEHEPRCSIPLFDGAILWRK
jgi:hypothetical protein